MEHASLGHKPILDCPDRTVFSRLVEYLKPGATGRDIVELLDGRPNRTTALHWKAGDWHAPKWALDLLAAKLTARVNREQEIVANLMRNHVERPGRKAGAKNLAAWRARQNKLKKP
jgi:hypothetical protein